MGVEFPRGRSEGYARELDFYGIELGVFGGGLPGLDIASKFTAGPAARHLEDPSTERRLYFSWVRPSPLAMYERELLNQAGIVPAGRKLIVTEGRQILKFVPRELEIRLARLNLNMLSHRVFRSPEAIAKTVFRSEGDGAGVSVRCGQPKIQTRLVVGGHRGVK